MLEVRGVSKSFDGFQAVGGVSFTVAPGSISAIIGPNGAGKTTLFNLITGHLRPDAGRVVFKGRDVTGIAPHDLCRLGMGRSFQRTNIFPRLTVFENVQAAYVSHRGRGWSLFQRADRLYRRETEEILRAVGLHERADEESRFLSHGGQKQLELGIAFGEGSDVTAEAAGAVILESSLERVDELLHIGARMRTIALQSAIGGMALSVVGMLVAAMGWLPPVAGAVAQELIDIFAVLNALRASFMPAVLSDYK